MGVVVIPALGQRHVGGRFVGAEIVVKLRPTAVQHEIAGGAPRGPSRHLDGLQALHARYRVREIRSLLTDLHERPLSRRRRQGGDDTRSTPKERRLARRQRRAHTPGAESGLDRVYRIRLHETSPEPVQEVLEAYRRHPDVEYAELNHVVSICAEPDDPLYTSQWALETMGAAEAWETCRGNAEIVVAVIDTGVDYDHRDLQGNLWFNEAERDGLAGVDDDENGCVDDIAGYNFIYNTADPMDDHGHGTHCAGTIAAATDNALDISGLCWNSRIMCVKVLGADGDGSSADAAVAIHYAVANGADVISASWGAEEESDVLRDAVAYAHAEGVLVVTAAGNEDSDLPYYPAAYPGAIGVAATDSDDRRWYLSNYGDWVDIAAPGRSILSLRAAGTSQGVAEDTYTTRMSGTSMATPHVSGACALLLSADPLLTYEDIRRILMSTGDPIPSGICASDARLNVAAAMRSAVPEKGRLRFDRDTYAEGDEVGVLLADWHLRGALAQTVVIETDDGDVESVTLTETASALGVLGGVLASERAEPHPGDGRIQVAHGRQMVARYLDVDDGLAESGQWSEAYAHADYEPATVVTVAVESRGHVATVDFTTSEPTRAEIRYGPTAGGPYVFKVDGLGQSGHHRIKLRGLTPGTRYYLVISLLDRAGNASTAADAGQGYTFVAGGDFEAFRVPDPYPTLQAAIDDASDGDVVWVADGTYSGEGNKQIDYAGKAITLRSENGPETCVIDCEGEGPAFYFHSGEGPDAVLDGFTITNGGEVDFGGGIQCTGSSPTIRNCIFLNNSADEYGGGLYNCYGSAPAIVNCAFEGNACSGFGWLSRGGGLCNRYDSSPTVKDCTFVGNSARYSGGGMGNIDRSSPHVIRCRFEGNWARYYGGAVGNWTESRPTFSQCVFSANEAGQDGGAMCNQISTTVIVGHCIFSDNLAGGSGGAIRNYTSAATLTNCTVGYNRAEWSCGGVWSGGDGDVSLNNCILWGNRDNGAESLELAQLMGDSSDIMICYSCVEGWTGALGGIGNVGHEPLFVDPNRGDFHLQSEGARWDGAGGVWVHDSASSPCIDAGHPGWPLRDEPMAVPDDSDPASAENRRINMGAYGGTTEASLAPSGWALLSDMDNDARVGWSDLVYIATDWLVVDGKRPGDVTRDGAVDTADLVRMGREWRHEAAARRETKGREVSPASH